MTLLTAERTEAPARRRRWSPRTRELVLLTLGSLALAVVMTWPTLADPWRTIPGDLTDPLFSAWEIGWYGHAVLHRPGGLFDANIYWPLPRTGVFSDTLLGLAPLGIGVSGMADTLFRYNVAYVLAAAFNFAGAYLLARQLGCGRIGAAVAGAAFAYTPWRISHAIHLNILMSGAIPLSIALLLRGHGIGRGPWDPARGRPWAAFAGWALAAWQVSLGFAIGLPFVYVLMVLGVAAVIAWLIVQRPRIPRRIVLADLAGGALFAGVTLSLASVFMRVAKDHPEVAATRTAQVLEYFSPPWRGLWAAPEHSLVWGRLTAGARAGIEWPIEATLLPGLIVVLAGLLGLVVTIWSRATRIWLAVAVVASVVAALGTTFAEGKMTWLPARELLPGVEALRTPGRLIMYAVLVLGLLAAGAITRLARHRRLRPFLLAVPLLVCAEGLSTVPHPEVPPPPAALAHAKGPVLILPAYKQDSLSLIWSTDGFRPQVNGYASFTPGMISEVVRITESFPSSLSIDYLRRMGVREVIIDRRRAQGTVFEPAAERPVRGLPVERRDLGDSVLYRLL
ncbi:hypothetical protein TBS_13720 [Thermobispora bispora]|uniref:hypothetical protein n=1 Tax=Thermobispora bispora TaxID=2006 RepID=UPI0030E97730|nr:hypothetical protein [Actinomycetales bacterium]MDI9580001.1 hypothetical protein [Thermobispora sp.]